MRFVPRYLLCIILGLTGKAKVLGFLPVPRQCAKTGFIGRFLSSPSSSAVTVVAAKGVQGGSSNDLPVVEWYMRHKRSNPSIELLEVALAQKDSLPEAELFTAALKECRYIGDGRKALNFLQAMQRFSSIRIRECDYISVIQACSGANMMAEAIDLFEQMRQEQSVHIGPQSYFAVIMACSRGGDPDRAWDYFGDMKRGEEGPRPDAACYAAMVETFRRNGRLEQALDLIREFEAQPGLKSSRLMLTATVRTLTDVGEPQKALQTFERLARVVDPDAGCLAAVLDALAELGDWGRALSIIDELSGENEGEENRKYGLSSSRFRSKGLRIGVQHYVAALRACAKVGEWEAALGTLERMRQRKVKPDGKCYRWALFACCKAAELDKAMELLLDTELEKRVSWTVPCYTTVMRALVKAGQTSKVLGLWDIMVHDRQIAPDGPTGDLVLSVAGKQKDWQTVQEILKELRNVGVEPRLESYGMIIEGRCQAGGVEDALELLRSIPHPNVVVYTSVISALGKRGDVEGALSLMEEMEGKGIVPDRVALTCLLDACLKGGALEEAFALASRLEEEALSQGTDEQALAVGLRAMIEQGRWEAARDRLQEVEDSLSRPAMFYSILIHAAAKEGHWRRAVGILLHMRERALPLGVMDISSAMNACRLAGEWEVALKLLQIMQERQRKIIERIERGGGKVDDDDSKAALEFCGPNEISYGILLDLFARQIVPSKN